MTSLCALFQRKTFFLNHLSLVGWRAKQGKYGSGTGNNRASKCVSSDRGVLRLNEFWKVEKVPRQGLVDMEINKKQRANRTGSESWTIFRDKYRLGFKP